MVQLTPIGGFVAAQVYRRDTPTLSWFVSVDFSPELAGEEAVLISDGIPWPFRDWRELDGATLDCDNLGAMQSALFLGGVEHDPVLATHTSIRLSRSEGRRFVVHVELDFHESEPEVGSRLSLVRELPFDGVLIQPLNVVPFPSDVEAARSLAESLIEPAAFLPPEFDGTSYVCAPRI